MNIPGFFIIPVFTGRMNMKLMVQSELESIVQEQHHQRYMLDCLFMIVNTKHSLHADWATP